MQSDKPAWRWARVKLGNERQVFLVNYNGRFAGDGDSLFPTLLGSGVPKVHHVGPAHAGYDLVFPNGNDKVEQTILLGKGRIKPFSLPNSYPNWDESVRAILSHPVRISSDEQDNALLATITAQQRWDARIFNEGFLPTRSDWSVDAAGRATFLRWHLDKFQHYGPMERAAWLALVTAGYDSAVLPEAMVRRILKTKIGGLGQPGDYYFEQVKPVQVDIAKSKPALPSTTITLLGPAEIKALMGSKEKSSDAADERKIARAVLAEDRTSGFFALCSQGVGRDGIEVLDFAASDMLRAARVRRNADAGKGSLACPVSLAEFQKMSAFFRHLTPSAAMIEALPSPMPLGELESCGDNSRTNARINIGADAVWLTNAYGRYPLNVGELTIGKDEIRIDLYVPSNHEGSGVVTIKRQNSGADPWERAGCVCSAPGKEDFALFE